MPLLESGPDILTVQGIPQLSDEKTALIKQTYVVLNCEGIQS